MEKASSPEKKISFEEFAETSPVTITTVDGEGNITYVNSRAKEVLGLEKSDITDLLFESQFKYLGSWLK